MRRMDNSTDLPTYQILDTEREDQPRSSPVELFMLSILIAFGTFIAVVLIAIAADKRPGQALDLAAMVSGGVLIGLMILLVLFAAGDAIERLMMLAVAAWVRRREIEARHEERMRELDMQERLSTLSVRVQIERSETARAALTAANQTPKALLLRSPAEEKLIDAIIEAYRWADPTTGYLPNDRPCPLGRRNLGADYWEISAWLADPGKRHGVVGAPPVATYDEDRKTWRLNLDKYPTAELALRALVGFSFADHDT